MDYNENMFECSSVPALFIEYFQLVFSTITIFLTFMISPKNEMISDWLASLSTKITKNGGSAEREREPLIVYSTQSKFEILNRSYAISELLYMLFMPSYFWFLFFFDMYSCFYYNSHIYNFK
jgi:hypothetical protein